MVAKKSAHKKTARTKSHSSHSDMKSFRVYRNAPPFMSFRVTKQTAYWTILLLVIFAIQLWVLKMQLDIATLTDAILSQ